MNAATGPVSSLDVLYGGEDRIPHFADSIASSFPYNSSPHIVAMSDFDGFFRRDAKRQRFVGALNDTLRALRKHIQVHGLLVAGSFLDLSKDPRDLDGALLYSARTPYESDWNAIKAVLENSRCQGLDLRPVPLDGNPLLMVKVVCFMTSLYLSHRESTQFANNGMLLVSCQP